MWVKFIFSCLDIIDTTLFLKSPLFGIHWVTLHGRRWLWHVALSGPMPCASPQFPALPGAWRCARWTAEDTASQAVGSLPGAATERSGCLLVGWQGLIPGGVQGRGTGSSDTDLGCHLSSSPSHGSVRDWPAPFPVPRSQRRGELCAELTGSDTSAVLQDAAFLTDAGGATLLRSRDRPGP